MMRQRAAEGLKEGDSFSVSRTISADDVERFAAISGDYNPVHVDLEYANARGFGGLIAHGLLTATLLTEIGGQIGWLAASMTFRFKSPVYIGDVLTCRWTIVRVDDHGKGVAEVSIMNANGLVVIEAETAGVIPGERERMVLARMIAAGDPTNLLANNKR